MVGAKQPFGFATRAVLVVTDKAGHQMFKTLIRCLKRRFCRHFTDEHKMSDKHNQDERTKANEDVQTMKSAVYLQIDEGREEIMT